jgi:hypothetical protein
MIHIGEVEQLSLQLAEDLWDQPHHNRPQPTFENLRNLRLEISNTAVMQWIEHDWKFPILKNLSLIDTASIDHISLLQGV